MAVQVCRSWNTCVKLGPATAILFMACSSAFCEEENHLSVSLLHSEHVEYVQNIFSHDIQSVTGSNLTNIGNLFHLDPRTDPAGLFKANSIGYLTPAAEEWRLPLLRKLLAKRSEFFTFKKDTSTIDELIEYVPYSSHLHPWVSRDKY
jgi:hypothetical protein